MDKIYAQIKSGKILNTIVLNDDSSTHLTLFGTGMGFDSIVRVDTLSPTPAIGWSYDGTHFAAPVATPISIYEWRTNAADWAQGLMTDFSIAKKAAGLSASQLLQLAGALAPMQAAMNLGDIQTVLTALPGVSVDGVLVTTADIANFTAEITAYIAANPVPS